MSSIVVIPCRMASTRLPGKILLTLQGKEMLRWVWETCQYAGADKVVVSSCDDTIRDFCNDHDIGFHTSSEHHTNGTERVAQVCREIGGHDIVVNVQADEPLITEMHIKQLITGLEENPDMDMATLYSTVELGLQIDSPSVVKVAMSMPDVNENRHALYFSRRLISQYKHHGIYAYRAESLYRLVSAHPTENEEYESLEQLRALDMGMKILCLESDPATPLHGVDVYDDLKLVSGMLKERWRIGDE